MSIVTQCKPIIDNYTFDIYVKDVSALTTYEKYAILAMFTANVTFNSFAAEVWFHADALTDWLSIFDSYYSKALRADMAIGEDSESGMFDRYYDLIWLKLKSQYTEKGIGKF